MSVTRTARKKYTPPLEPVLSVGHCRSAGISGKRDRHVPSYPESRRVAVPVVFRRGKRRITSHHQQEELPIVSSAARWKDVLRGTMDEASSLGLLHRSRLALSGRESDWSTSFSDPMMGEPSGSSRREARLRGEHHPGKRRRSRKALDLNRPNREEPGFGAATQPIHPSGESSASMRRISSSSRRKLGAPMFSLRRSSPTVLGMTIRLVSRCQRITPTSVSLKPDGASPRFPASACSLRPGARIRIKRPVCRLVCPLNGPGNRRRQER